MLLGTQWYSSANGCVSPVRCVPYITSHGGLSGIGEKVAKIQNKKVTLIITNSVIPLHYDTTIRLRFSCFLTENNEIFLLNIIGPVCSDCSKLLFMMTLLFNCKPPFMKLVPSHKSHQIGLSRLRHLTACDMILCLWKVPIKVSI